MIKNKRTAIGFVFLMALALLACIATFSVLSGGFHIEVILSNFVLNIPFVLLVEYVDYSIVAYLHRRYRRLDILPIVINILIADAFIGGLSVIFACIRKQDIWQQLLPAILCNSFIVLVMEIFFYYKLVLENKAQLAIMEKEKAQYQLEALKKQINPHFLFNSLNVLSALAYQDAGKANLFAKKLSSVYRYLLTTQDAMKVPLQDELDFVKSYIYLEQIRFGETLRMNITCEEEALNRYIVPASIQMLIENALKHNINTKSSPLRISICIGKESVTVTNNLQLRASVSKNRIGLDNLEKQYRIHNRHIQVEKSDSEFTVTLPLLNAGDA